MGEGDSLTVIKRQATLMSDGRGRGNGEVGGCGHHGVNPYRSPGASPLKLGALGQEVPERVEEGR